MKELSACTFVQLTGLMWARMKPRVKVSQGRECSAESEAAESKLGTDLSRIILAAANSKSKLPAMAARSEFFSPVDFS